MKFSFETEYNQNALSVMAKGIRRTVRKKRNRGSHIIGMIVILIALLRTIPILRGEADINSDAVITWVVTFFIAVVLLFEDKINGYVARKRMLVGMKNSTAVFEDDKYSIITDFGKTEFCYTNINQLAETNEYFIFIFDMSHAQIYDKNNITGGSAEEFSIFIKEKTDKEITYVK